MKTCPHCGESFDNPKRKYCSEKCYNRAKVKRAYKLRGKGKVGEERFCKQCGAKIEFISRTHQKFCSADCSSNARIKYLSIPDCLENASRKLDKNIGYVRVYCPMHPKSNSWGYVYEHRLIMEGQVGRYLTHDEHVHHINGKRWDNRPENLQLTTASEHAKITAKDNKKIVSENKRTIG